MTSVLFTLGRCGSLAVLYWLVGAAALGAVPTSCCARPISRPHLAHIRPHLAHTSPIPRLYLAHISQVATMCGTLLATHLAGRALERRTASRAAEAAGLQSA